MDGGGLEGAGGQSKNTSKIVSFGQILVITVDIPKVKVVLQQNPKPGSFAGYFLFWSFGTFFLSFFPLEMDCDTPVHSKSAILGDN